MNWAKYSINEKVIIDNIKSIGKTSNGTIPVWYTVKANNNPFVIRAINAGVRLSGGFQINSEKEFNRLINCKIRSDKVMFINILSNSSVLDNLYRRGVRKFVFGFLDSLIDFKHLDDCDIILRLSLNGFSSKFNTSGASQLGFTLKEFGKAVDFLKSRGKTDFKVQIYVNADLVENGFNYDDLSRVITFLSLNLGISINSIFIDGSKFYDLIPKNDLVKFAGLGLGNKLLENGVDLYTEVLARSENNIYLSAGVYTGLLDKILFDRKFDLEFRGKPFCKIKSSNLKEINVFGCSCDTKDYIGTYYVSDKIFSSIIKEEIVTIKNVGAYCDVFNMSYASDTQFNYYMEELL